MKARVIKSAVESRQTVKNRRNFSSGLSRFGVKARPQNASALSQESVKRPAQISKTHSQIAVNGRTPNAGAVSQLILSVFHGADLLGRGFEQEGFCVVRAAELDLGFDVRALHIPKERFDGIIAGSPCQDFSLANRSKRTFEGYGAEMLEEFKRLIIEGEPNYFLLENVPSVPRIEIEGYKIQRFYLNASECGLKQNRLRYFQFGSKEGLQLIIDRLPTETDLEPCVMASEGTKRGFSKFCELQGLPKDFDLPVFKTAHKYKAVGNGVAVPMGAIIARSIRRALSAENDSRFFTLCACECGRVVTGRQKYALPRCRKRAQLDREAMSKN